MFCPAAAPKILYIVPTFGWTRSQDAQGRLTSWRRGGGLRIYLDRKWNLSGYGEMLAVVLPPASFAGEPETEPKNCPLQEIRHSMGQRPRLGFAFRRRYRSQTRRFPPRPHCSDPTGAWLPWARRPRSRSKAGRSASPELIPAGVGTPGSVEIAPHDVFYDPDRRLWYCDDQIEAGASYCPFIRLALARYQPISSDGAHLQRRPRRYHVPHNGSLSNVTPLEDHAGGT
ncbi:MAG: hypothetical protein U1G07_11395 [Verrucomicrobiota bacterium]